MYFKKKTNRDIELEMDFTIYSFNQAVFFKFYNELESWGVKVLSIISDEEYYSDFEKVLREDISKGLIIKLSGGYSLHFNRNNHKNKSVYSFSFYFEYTKTIYDKIMSFVKEVNEIYYGYLRNYYDAKWQNEESILTYNINKKSTKGLSFGLDVFDKKCVDTSKNYGRSIFNDGILYSAAYCTWFSSHFEDILTEKFDFAYSVDCLDNGLIQVILFEDVLGDYSKYRKNQKEFLKWLELI